MKLVLCGHGDACIEVLRQAAAAQDIQDVYLLTHDPVPYLADILPVAKELDLPGPSESINPAKLPFQPDAISSVWYRRIIHQPVIDLVGGAIFNLHPSLLP